VGIFGLFFGYISPSVPRTGTEWGIFTGAGPLRPRFRFETTVRAIPISEGRRPSVSEPQ